MHIVDDRSFDKTHRINELFAQNDATTKLGIASPNVERKIALETSVVEESSIRCDLLQKRNQLFKAVHVRKFDQRREHHVNDEQ